MLALTHALGAERSGPELMERILLEAKAITRAEGGTLYLRDAEDRLQFEILRNDRLGIARGGTTGAPVGLPPVPLFGAGGVENHAHVAAHAVHRAEVVEVEDAYATDRFDFSGTRSFDAETGYRSRSFLTVPLQSREGRVIGALQLINARDEEGAVVPFDPRRREVAVALAAQAAVLLEARLLYEEQRKLLDAFLHVIAESIDRKSPYTGGHCRRVPALTEMLVHAMHEVEDGPFAEVRLDEDAWYELHVASWLHDCGKITTPPHVMDKAMKLEGVRDGLDAVAARFCAAAAQGADRDELAAELEFLRRVNRGGESMSREDQERVRRLAERSYLDLDGVKQPLLTDEEVENLQVARGTLTEAERLVINGHMVETVLMLDALPFPAHLRNVPHIACGHHERMNGEGYPRGLYAGDMLPQARAMAIADVFEALTAADRPYKPPMKLSQALGIMSRMKEGHHLDPDLFDLFVTSGVYRRYAERFLEPEQIDHVDEAALLAARPPPLELPPREERDRRWTGFLPKYQPLARR